MIELHLQQLETWEPGAVRVCVGTRGIQRINEIVENCEAEMAWAKLQFREKHFMEGIVTGLGYYSPWSDWQDVPLATSPDAAP